MRWYLRRTMAAALMVATVACSRDSTTAPVVAAGEQGDLLGVAPQLTFLVCPSATTHSATETIDGAGGTIAFGPHSLTIPRGALSEPVSITATAPAGQYVRAEMSPHGLQFAKKATLSLGVVNCGILPGLLRIVYVDDSFNILDVLPTINSLIGGTVSARLDHFSGYMVSH